MLKTLAARGQSTGITFHVRPHIMSRAEENRYALRTDVIRADEKSEQSLRSRYNRQGNQGNPLTTAAFRVTYCPR